MEGLFFSIASSCQESGEQAERIDDFFPMLHHRSNLLQKVRGKPYFVPTITKEKRRLKLAKSPARKAASNHLLTFHTQTLEYLPTTMGEGVHCSIPISKSQEQELLVIPG